MIAYLMGNYDYYTHLVYDVDGPDVGEDLPRPSSTEVCKSDWILTSSMM